MNYFHIFAILTGTVLGSVGCAPTAGDDYPGAPLELGVQWVGSDPGDDDMAFRLDQTLSPNLDPPDSYARWLASDIYSGKSLIRVRRTYDVTDTSDQVAEQTVVLKTTYDEEHLTTWDTLDKLSSQTAQTQDGTPLYWVSLSFSAELSTSPTRFNGILEVRPDEEDELSVEWAHTGEDDSLHEEYLLEAVE